MLGRQYSLKYTRNNEPVVWIDEDIFTDKSIPNHQIVANYLVEHIGDVYTIVESGQNVYLGKELPSEYTQSKYTTGLLSRPTILKAKNKGVVGLGEMILIATRKKWEKVKHSRNKDAKYGIYKYKTKFAFPVYDANKNIVRVNAYNAVLVILNSSDGKNIFMI